MGLNDDSDLASVLRENGYIAWRLMPDGTMNGVMKFLFTYGLMVGFDLVGYRRRYCYGNLGDAVAALATWDGAGDPPGPWIKEKPSDRCGPGAKGRQMRTRSQREPNEMIDKLAALEAVMEPLLRADKKDWERLEAHLAKDMGGHGRFWQEVLREVREALAAIKEDV